MNNEIKVRAKDFLKNMKILSSKYFVDKHLYENFCALVERDLKEDCKCTKKPCPKSCLMLDFCNLADVLDSISTVNYVYKDKVTLSTSKSYLKINFRILTYTFYPGSRNG